MDAGAARVDAFVTRFSARHFPLYEQDEYAGLLGRIPFVTFGWSSDEFHDVAGLHTGHLLMLALVEDIYEGYRGALLNHLTTLGFPTVLLAQLAGGGLPRDELRRRLNGGPRRHLGKGGLREYREGSCPRGVLPPNRSSSAFSAVHSFLFALLPGSIKVGGMAASVAPLAGRRR